jgi:hypothetical protein
MNPDRRKHCDVVGEPEWCRRPDQWVCDHDVVCVKSLAAKQGKIYPQRKGMVLIRQEFIMPPRQAWFVGARIAPCIGEVTLAS